MMRARRDRGIPIRSDFIRGRGGIAGGTFTMNASDNLPGGYTAPTSFLSLPGGSTSFASTPDAAANSITGDIDIRVKAALTDWTPPLNQGFVNKNVPSTNQRSYRFAITTAGRIFFQGTSSGTVGTLFFGQSTASPTVQDGATLWLRVTVDVDDGASHNVINFYTSTETSLTADAVTWSQLGTTITNAGATSFFDGTADVEIGGNRSSGESTAIGKIYYADIRSGIGGAPVVVFNPADASIETSPSSFTSRATGEVWTINGNASLARA